MPATYHREQGKPPVRKPPNLTRKGGKGLMSKRRMRRSKRY